ncbi:MAG TPA: hypothetical protein VJP86_05000 [Vicinamibacterales bacterium]|jgi:urease accessory protein|nr:hypothetical protein [Vicinamibacterales bacterium]
MLFKALPVARLVYRSGALPERVSHYARDTMTLGWEERLRARGRRRTDNDVEFGSALPRGTVLRQDDCLVIDEAHLVVTVIELDEPVFVVAPSDPEQWALWGYAIGNSHQPMMVTSGAIVCPDVPGMRQVLDYHGIPFRCDSRRFTPVGSGRNPYSAAHQHAPSAE